MIIAAVQYLPPKQNRDQALEEIRILIREAAAQGASFIVLPELALSGYVWNSQEHIHEVSEECKGAYAVEIAAYAREHSSWIVYGYAEHDRDYYYNSAALISPDGRIAANYRKVYLFEMDMSWARAGEKRLVLEADAGIITPGICMDLNDDGFTSFLIESKSDITPFPTSWLEEGLDVHRYWCDRLSGYSGAFIAANRWGIEDGITFCGASAIIKNGSVIARGPKEGNAVVVSEI